MKIVIEKDCSGITFAASMENEEGSIFYSDAFLTPEDAINYLKDFNNNLIKALKNIEIIEE